MKKFFFYISLVLAGSFFLSCKQKPIPYGNNPDAGKYYNIRGFTMYCEVYGTGKPLLMIHGNGGSIKTFAANIPYFSKKYKVIIADSRAQGKSKDDADSLSFEMMADDEAALLDALHVDSAYVIGWSDGGNSALLLAIRHPGKVIKLASTGANLWPDSSAITAAEWLDDKAVYDSLKDKKRMTAEEKTGWKLFLLDWQQPNISLASLHSIQSPSLIICGDHDVITTAHTALISQNIPQSNLWIVPNSGHATFKEHKDEFNKKIDDFFAKPFRSNK
ncbi:MAG: alpha/beta hydrolase [Bacteroidota bacterium]|nr:alpha/beta hydrolase [Bacteroidota bacterium]MDQ6889939.1 alpha/beta hydrolase [Bacteroidota bacterium]